MGMKRPQTRRQAKRDKGMKRSEYGQGLERKRVSTSQKDADEAKRWAFQMGDG